MKRGSTVFLQIIIVLTIQTCGTNQVTDPAVSEAARTLTNTAWIEILTHLLAGRPPKEIAPLVGCSRRTVERLRTDIIDKLKQFEESTR